MKGSANVIAANTQESIEEERRVEGHSSEEEYPCISGGTGVCYRYAYPACSGGNGEPESDGTSQPCSGAGATCSNQISDREPEYDGSLDGWTDVFDDACGWDSSDRPQSSPEGTNDCACAASSGPCDRQHDVPSSYDAGAAAASGAAASCAKGGGSKAEDILKAKCGSGKDGQQRDFSDRGDSPHYEPQPRPDRPDDSEDEEEDEDKDDNEDDEQPEDSGYTERFADMGLREDLLRGVFDYGLTVPTPIYCKVIAPMGRGRDVVAQASSGTGKTTAFCIGLLQRIDTSRSRTHGAPQALVLAPVRELATYIGQDLQSIGHRMGVRVRICVGGLPVQEDVRAIHAGIDVVVGTVGRIQHMQASLGLDLSELQILVLDEMDTLFLTDQYFAMRDTLLGRLPPSTQACMFSATMDDRAIARAQHGVKEDCLWIAEKAKDLTLEGVKQYVVEMQSNDDKLATLAEIYERVPIYKAIIFCNTIAAVEAVSRAMRAIDCPVSSTHGDMKMAERQARMKEFRDGTTRLLVSTDLLGRGIDVDHVTLVINYDQPVDTDKYMHRVGRSGRMGRRAAAVTFVSCCLQSFAEDIMRHCHTVLEELPADIETALGAGPSYPTAKHIASNQDEGAAETAGDGGEVSTNSRRDERAAVEETGRDERAAVEETGRDERAAVEETGRDERAAVEETGRDERAAVEETGRDERAAVEETGVAVGIRTDQQEAPTLETVGSTATAASPHARQVGASCSRLAALRAIRAAWSGVMQGSTAQ